VYSALGQIHHGRLDHGGDPADAEPKRRRRDLLGGVAGIRKFLERLPEVDGTAAACFDTRFDKSRILTGSAAKAMARRLGRRGYRIVAEPESFFVLDSEGPLKEGELDRARRWGASLGTAADVSP